MDWNNVSPRIGVAYDPTGKGTSVIRFGYGMYYIMQGTGLAETANPVGLSGKYYAWTDTNGDGIPQQSEWLPQGAHTIPVGAFGGSSTHINPNMSRPYSEEISAGYEKQIWRDLARQRHLLLPHQEEPDRHREHGRAKVRLCAGRREVHPTRLRISR